MAQGRCLLPCAFMIMFFTLEALAFHSFCPVGDSPERSQLNATTYDHDVELQIAPDRDLDSEVKASDVAQSVNSGMCYDSWLLAGTMIQNVSREEQLLKRRLREQQQRDSETAEEREARRQKRRERDERRRRPETAEESEARRQKRRERDERRRLRDPEEHQERLTASRECEDDFRQQHPQEHQEIKAARRQGYEEFRQQHPEEHQERLAARRENDEQRRRSLQQGDYCLAMPDDMPLDCYLATFEHDPAAAQGLYWSRTYNWMFADYRNLDFVEGRSNPSDSLGVERAEKLKQAIISEGTITDRGIEEAMSMYTALMDPTKPALACASCGIMDVPVSGEPVTAAGDDESQFVKGIRRAATSGTAAAKL